MDSTLSTTGDVSSKQHLWPRDQISQLVEHLRLDQSSGASLNQSASETGVPRTTAYDLDAKPSSPRKRKRHESNCR